MMVLFFKILLFLLKSRETYTFPSWWMVEEWSKIWSKNWSKIWSKIQEFWSKIQEFWSTIQECSCKSSTKCGWSKNWSKICRNILESSTKILESSTKSSTNHQLGYFHTKLQALHCFYHLLHQKDLNNRMAVKKQNGRQISRARTNSIGKTKK